MEYRIEKSFARDYKKIKDKQLSAAILEAIMHVEKSNTINDIPNIKKMKGADDAYCIRINDYRIGIYVENNSVIFTVFDHRKDIYKRFP